MMLDQLFSKIQIVQKDLYSNFTLTGRKHVDNEFVKQEAKSTPSIELCNHYQLKWNELHQQMERNVNLIADSQKCLQELNDLSGKQLQSQQNFNSTLSSLHEIESGLQELDEDLENVLKSIEIVEKLLNNYEKKKCQESLKKLEQTGQIDYQNASQSKLIDFENYKHKLLNDHNKKAKEIEKLQFVKFKQKSTVYLDNFKKEIDTYLRTGKLPNRTLIDNAQQPVADREAKSLEEIDVETDDQDMKALNEFLDD